MSIRLPSLVVAFAALLASATARAQTMPNCDTGLSAPPIYLSGSTALEPLIKALGKVLAASSTPYSLVYLGDGSCEGVHKFIPIGGGTTVLSKANPLKYIDASFDPNKAVPMCTLTADTPADLGMSDVFATVCSGAAVPSGIADILGPAQVMLFVTNPNSTQQAISAEQAYLALGLGTTGSASPWVDPMYFFIRPDSSGTKNLLAAAINVPVAKWQGVSKDPTTGKGFGSGDVLTHVAMESANAEKVLGILGADIYDGNRDKVKALAFRAYKQWKAYWPDSTPTSLDKKNARDGHYTALGYAHFIANVDSNGAVTNNKAKLVIDLATQKASLAGIDTIKVLAQTAHLIPQCAMKVKRVADGGDLSLYSDPAPCGCYFDSLVGGTPAAGTCKACTPTGNECGSTGTCRNNFCEAR
jgi:ABC-type phosphate transport system substrate-binding protein